jgi:hypothetical protein
VWLNVNRDGKLPLALPLQTSGFAPAMHGPKVLEENRPILHRIPSAVEISVRGVLEDGDTHAIQKARFDSAPQFRQFVDQHR